MNRRLGLLGASLVLGGAVLIGAGAVVGEGFGSAGMIGSFPVGEPGEIMGGVHGTAGGTGMMGGNDWAHPTSPGPGAAGFVAGTVAAPRVIPVLAGPGFTFTPATIPVARGETVTFEVTSMGGLVHEFMVGPADAVASDQEGTPEVADIGMMQTKSVTYTFDGAGPYAFACHAPGHYEAGMRGTITVVG
jgi:uncharacterized cupredoxin-like copper-binding protein